MTPLNSRLQLALLNRKKGRNALEKGFTLVELMIVIVIVGILSAVALPQFLAQRKKAIATEAITQVGALTSAAVTESLETPLTAADFTDGSCEKIAGGAPGVNTTKFTYTCVYDATAETGGITITGEGVDGQPSQGITVSQQTPNTAVAGVLSSQRGDITKTIE